MVNYPKEVIARTAKGPEIRTLVSRGRYVMCEYRKPETMELVGEKKKLILISENGEVEEYFIIPLKQPKKSLLIKSEKKSKNNQMVWNVKTKKPEII